MTILQEDQTRTFREVESEMKRIMHAKRQYAASAMERCVLCWKLTDIPKDGPIRTRSYYVPGQGQLCARCYRELFPA